MHRTLLILWALVKLNFVQHAGKLVGSGPQLNTLSFSEVRDRQVGFANKQLLLTRLLFMVAQLMKDLLLFREAVLEAMLFLRSLRVGTVGTEGLQMAIGLLGVGWLLLRAVIISLGAIVTHARFI